MSLIVFDGFDGYQSSGDLKSEGPWTFGSGNITTSETPFNEGKSLWSASSYKPAITLADQSAKTVYIGFNFYKSSTAPDTFDLFSIFEDSAPDSAPVLEQLSVGVTDGYIEVYRGNFTTSLATGTIYMPSDAWYYLEFKILVHNSTGVFENKVSGTTDISISSQDTQQETSDSVLSFRFVPDNTITNYVDDFWICNSDGSAPHNTYLGPIRCQQLLPNGDNSIVWSRNTGSTNYQQIDEEASIDGDSTYVYSATPSDKDLFDMEAMNTDVTTVLALKTKSIARKSDASAKSYKLGIKHSTNEQLSSARTLTESYVYDEENFITSDGSSTAWTETTVNAALLVIEDQ